MGSFMDHHGGSGHDEDREHGGDPGAHVRYQTLYVSKSAVPEHLEEGDSIGGCSR